MKCKMKIFRDIVICISVLLCILITVDYIRIRQQIHDIKTEIIEVKDTVEKVSYDTVYVDRPIVYNVNELGSDTKQIWSPQIEDSVYVELPVIQKEYQDSTYRAWVSGYQEVNLDSIRVFKEKQILEINNTNYITKYKNRPFSVGIQVGAQYNFITKRPEPYLGLGVQYNLFSFGKRK